MRPQVPFLVSLKKALTSFVICDFKLTSTRLETKFKVRTEHSKELSEIHNKGQQFVLSSLTSSIDFEVPKCSPNTDTRNVAPTSSRNIDGKGVKVDEISNGLADKLGLYGIGSSGEI